jgi:epimerase transport system membrane fusion protein
MATPLVPALPRDSVRAAPEVRTDDRYERRLGLAILLAGVGGFVGWASFAPIDSAAVAPGVVTVEFNRKTVQHLEGGIVRDILVREGERVAPGHLLVRLDDTQALAQLEIVRSQYLASRAQEARLIAERDGYREVVFPDDLLAARADPRVQEAIAGQQQVFAARSRALSGEKEVLEQRIEQLNEQIRGLEALSASKLSRIESYKAEIKDFKKLYEKGLTDRLRLREMERLAAELEGERAEHQSSMAAAQVQIGETRLQIIQVERKQQTEVAQELRDTQAKLSDLRERVRALEDTVLRTEVKAPVGGAVVGLLVHTVGGVVSPGGRILDIVPQDEQLIVEARVAPTDADRVSPGLEAQLRFSAFNARTTPTVVGQVLTVSGDRITDQQTKDSYYLARIQVSKEGMAELRGLTLLPGMPVDVMIKTGERTFFQYLVKPITDRLAKSFRED